MEKRVFDDRKASLKVDVSNNNWRVECLTNSFNGFFFPWKNNHWNMDVIVFKRIDFNDIKIYINGDGQCRNEKKVKSICLIKWWRNASSTTKKLDMEVNVSNKDWRVEYMTNSFNGFFLQWKTSIEKWILLFSKELIGMT